MEVLYREKNKNRFGSNIYDTFSFDFVYYDIFFKLDKNQFLL